MTESIYIGNKIPEFNLDTTITKKCSKADMTGCWSILFIYPKDNTSGCSKENEDFNNFYEKFQSLNIKTFGLSKDTIKSHESFASKLSLKFPLISDPDCILIKKLGCWVEKSMYGKKYMGVERTTFLINPMAEIAFVWRKVKVRNHVEEILSKIEDIR